MRTVFASPMILGVLGLVALFIIVVGLIVKRYSVAGPDQAFIITGRKGKEAAPAEPGAPTKPAAQKVVLGGGVFVWPFVQKKHVMDLSSRRISVQVRGAVSQLGVKLNLDGIAIVKVGGDEDSVRAAGQRFLSQQAEIDAFTTEVLSGALRSIVGGLTVEEVIRDRSAFASKVAEESEASLTGQGLVLDAFQIQDVTADGRYLEDLGRPEAARVSREAEVAEAIAHQQAEEARLKAEEEIANAARALALRQAAIKSETDAAAAEAAAAGPLAEAERSQAVLAEQEKVAEREAALTERQLDTQVRRPADAERYRVEQEAEAQRSAEIARADAAKAATIAAAEALAQQEKLLGEGERSHRAAVAEAVRLEGSADGAAILARGEAEAAAMRKKAEAYEQYGNAAVIDMLVRMLPEMAKEVAAPMANIDTLTVVSTEGAGALPKQVTSTLTQTLAMVKDATGLDLGEMLQNMTRSGSAVPALAAGVVADKVIASAGD